ncbi:MAG: phenylacetate--CoA ligase family protein [Verrucomicrobia bacterium]|nr:phenylacetate--CoA ligase family protein [Verrucomicrobiota bacterium]
MEFQSEQATSYERELSEQTLWRLKSRLPNRPQLEGIAALLIENEFREPEEMQKWIWHRLKHFLQFAVNQVPYYRQLAGQLGMDVRDLESPSDLTKIPSLTKGHLRQYAKELHAEILPGGYDVIRSMKSSGTTGEPVNVDFSRLSLRFFGMLKQREFRWCRYKPEGLMAYIRPPDDFPHDSYEEIGKTYRSSIWPYVGAWFHTNRSVGYDHTRPVDEQVAWLNESRANYLVIESGALESLAFGQENAISSGHLEGIQSVATQLTSDMRRRAESVFDLRIDQNYGLNEIGIVASRCPEGGRYHVHSEHCYLEIVDDNGQPARPGEMGRILVTGLNNLAMPILRYDTDDLAEVVTGPCPCGRTLPSFGKIMGRYRRSAYLPGYTWQYWENFRNAFESMPQTVLKSLRQYQLHQFTDGSFEFRYVAVGDSATAFEEYISRAWLQAVESIGAGEKVKFEIKRVKKIPKSRGRKYQNFTSDFAPPEDGSDPYAISH